MSNLQIWRPLEAYFLTPWVRELFGIADHVSKVPLLAQDLFLRASINYFKLANMDAPEAYFLTLWVRELFGMTIF